jgi:hypothetical protein
MKKSRKRRTCEHCREVIGSPEARYCPACGRLLGSLYTPSVQGGRIESKRRKH